MIIWGGFEYALSEAITSKSAGKERIQQALFGLVLVLSPALVFTIINPSILKLDVNIPKLETEWGTYDPTLVCNDPDGCTVETVSGGGRSPITGEDVGLCDGNDCSKKAGECVIGGTITSVEKTAVCWDASTKKYTGGKIGVTTAPTSCPTGSVPAILCKSSVAIPAVGI